MDKQTPRRGRGTLGWIVRFAGKRKGSYIASVVLAILNVVCGFIPFIYLAHITKGLLEKTADFRYCLAQCLWMAVFFILSRLFHAFSTTLSHRATFEVLANVRRQLTRKLARMPLGDVLDESSGTYKNIIVERVDSIETTLAHMIPEAKKGDCPENLVFEVADAMNLPYADDSFDAVLKDEGAERYRSGIYQRYRSHQGFRQIENQL